MVVPVNSGFAGSPGGKVTGCGARVPTMTAGSFPGGGGSGSPNHGPFVNRLAGPRSGPSCAKAA